MKNIKTKEVTTKPKTKNPASRIPKELMRTAILESKEKSQTIANARDNDMEEQSPSEYASGKVASAEEWAARKSGRTVTSAGKTAAQTSYEKIKQRAAGKKEVEKEALADGVPIIRRSMQSLLGFLLRTRKPDAVLEIGTAVGFSAMLMRENLKPDAVLDTIEKVPMRIQAAKQNFEKYNKSASIRLLEGDAKDVLEQLVKEQKQYDFIFMDAAKGQYMHFLPMILSLLTKDGMLVTDNVLQDGDIIQSRYAITKRDRTIHGRMREYLYTLTHSDKLDSVIMPVGDGVALTTWKAQ